MVVRWSGKEGGGSLCVVARGAGAKGPVVASLLADLALRQGQALRGASWSWRRGQGAILALCLVELVLKGPVAASSLMDLVLEKANRCAVACGTGGGSGWQFLAVAL